MQSALHLRELNHGFLHTSFKQHYSLKDIRILSKSIQIEMECFFHWHLSNSNQLFQSEEFSSTTHSFFFSFFSAFFSFFSLRCWDRELVRLGERELKDNLTEVGLLGEQEAEKLREKRKAEEMKQASKARSSGNEPRSVSVSQSEGPDRKKKKREER